MEINTAWVFFTVTGISFGAGTALGVLILFLTQASIAMGHVVFFTL